MKKLFALLLSLALMFTLCVSALATEVTQPSSSDAAETVATGPNGANVMAVICGILAVLGGIYLFFGLKRSKDL